VTATEERWCTLCGKGPAKKQRYAANFSIDDLQVSTFSARRAPDRRHFRLVECSRCGIIFSDPACSPERLGELYSQSLVTYGPQQEQIFDSYAPILDRAAARLARRDLFVEIGGGAGFMLQYGAAAGFASQVEVEPSADAERKFSPPSPRATFVRSVMKPGTLVEGSASLICFFQMLDHLPDPLGFLKLVYGALQPGGVAVAVTHDSSALSTRLLGEASPIFDIEHTFLFNARNLHDTFAAAGFEKIETFPVANDYALKYWLHLAPLPAAPKRIVERAVELVGAADLRLKLKMGNVAAIGQKANRP
jgi:SAM-dependent methyltransferase